MAENLSTDESIVIESFAITHPHEPYEDIVSFTVNRFAAGEQPWQVQQYSEGALVDSEYFDSESDALKWTAREATLVACVARHQADPMREALEAAEHWLEEERRNPGQATPDEILRVIGAALGKVNAAIRAAEGREG